MRVEQVPTHLDDPWRVMWDRVDRLIVRVLDALKRNCFVAGTLVHTIAGVVPIEDIRAGDVVLSADEVTGELGYRPVLETYRKTLETETPLWHVWYRRDGDRGDEEKELVTTAEHPFWSESAGEFVAASVLQVGDRLRLAGPGGNRETARVTRVYPERGPPQRTVVYNFAVADHHTYFVGQAGVWVHNDCKDLIKSVVADHSARLSRYVDDGMPFDDAYDLAQTKALEWMAKKPNYTRAQRFQTAIELLEMNPKIIDGKVADDVDVLNRLLDDTGLRIKNPSAENVPQPASVARAGDGSEPFFAIPKDQLPEDLAKFVDELEPILLARAGELNWSETALKNALRVISHSEALTLMRMRDKFGDLSKFNEIHIATAGRHVCGICVNDGASAGLARIAEALGIKRLVVRADSDPLPPRRRFQSLSFGDDPELVIIENGRVTSP